MEVAKAKGNFGKIVSGGDGGDKSRGGIENKSAKAKAKKRKRKLREEGGDAAGTSAKRVSGGKLLHDYQERQKNKKIKKKNKKDGRDGKDGGGKDSVGKKGGRNKNWKRDREMQWEKEEDERLHRKNLQQNAAKRSGGGKKGKKGGRR